MLLYACLVPLTLAKITVGDALYEHEEHEKNLNQEYSSLDCKQCTPDMSCTDTNFGVHLAYNCIYDKTFGVQ